MVSNWRYRAIACLVFASQAAAWYIAAPGVSSRPSSCSSRTQPVARRSSIGVGFSSHGRSRVLPRRQTGSGGDPFRQTSSSADSAEHGLKFGSEEDVPNDVDVEPMPRPFPKVGDVVRYKGKWESDVSFGEIRQLQKVDETGQWRAYVLGLDDIGDAQYARKKNRKSKAEDVTTLRPVRAFYVRSVDGFKVMTDTKTGEPRYISDAYELEDFELPKIEVDPVKLAADLESYEDLKRRLVLDTATFGAVGALAAFQIFGAERGLLVALGALASVGYVILLEKTADDVASGKRDVLTQAKGNARFAMPILLIAVIALKNYLAQPEAAKLLNLIPKDDFAAAMLGFVAPSRLPLLYREVRSSLKGDEVLDMLPGSLGQGRQILRGMRDSGGSSTVANAEVAAAPSATKIIVVSGPRCLGKTTLVNKMRVEDSRLGVPVWCTTRPLRSQEVDGQDATVVGQVKFDEMVRKGSFLHTYQDESGESYGLRLEDVLAVTERGKVCVVDADRQMVKALMGISDVALIGVWVSLDSIEAIEERIRATLRGTGQDRGSSDFESDVRGLVRQAVDDIEFGIMSGVFDFTVINDDESEAMKTVRRAVEFATS